jgi:predicted amidohydrolase
MSTNSGRRAAIAQLCSTSNKLSNLVNVAKCAGLARAQGASMLFLPECFGLMSENSLQTLEQAEPPISDDESQNEERVQEQLRSAVRRPHEAMSVEETENVSLLDGLKVIAQTSEMWISAGGMHESGAPPDDEYGDRPRVYNTHVIIDNKGKVQTLYRKSHLFDVSIPNKVNLRESTTTAPGTKLVVCDSPIGMYCV